jgi:CRP-like cAMP-binding protein
MLRPVIRRSCQYARCAASSSSLFQKQQQQLFPSLLQAIRPSTTCTSSEAAGAEAAAPSTILTKKITTTKTATATATATASEILRRTLIPSVFASQESIKNALPIIGNGAYMALASGFLMTDMISLRLMLVGGYTGLVAFHALHNKPLQIPLRWSALFVVVNAGAALLLFSEEWIGALLSEEELALYEEHFKDDDGLTKGQFYYLMKMSKQEHIKDGSVLTQEGRPSPNLYFIHTGKAKVFHHNAFAAYIDEGGFVNDVAFQQQQQQPAAHECSSNDDNNNEQQDDNNNNSINRTVGRTPPTPPGVGAYGTVITHGDCTVVVWNQSELKQYLEKRPDMDRNMKYTLSRHLVKSLLKQREARRHKGTSTSSSTILQEQQQGNDLQVEFQRINTKRTDRERGFHDDNDEHLVDNNNNKCIGQQQRHGRRMVSF